jgi:hypothetical protein
MLDGSTLDVTRSASWLASNSRIATVSSSGSVTIVGNGEVDVRATYQGVTGSMHIDAVNPSLKFTLNGTVTTADSVAHPIAGARVQIVLGPYAFSDDHGSFTLANVPSGRAIVEVTRAGYQTYTNEIDVDNDRQLAITLSPVLVP